MKWVKAPDDLKVILEKAMAGIDCDKRPMFGYPAYFINRNMFAGLFGKSVYFRFSDEQAGSLRRKHPSIAPLEPMPGRPMKGYYAVPEALYRDEKALRKAAADSADYTRTLPPKEKKTPRSRKA